jgi:carbamoyltransferase
MTQLILGVHSGSHDAAAAIFEDYLLKAAVHLERLTRLKGDGTRHRILQSTRFFRLPE